MEVYTENFCKALNQKFDIFVLTRKLNRQFYNEKVGNVNVIRVPWINNILFKTPSFNFLTFLLLFRIRPDIIFSQGPISSLFALFYSKLCNTSLYSRSIGISYIEPQFKGLIRYFLKTIESYVYFNSSHFIFLSDSEINKYTKSFRGLPQNYSVIHTGVDQDIYKPRNKSSDEMFRIFVSCRLINRKGIHNFLFSLLHLKNRENLEVNIAGEGPLKRVLVYYSKKFLKDININFLGFVGKKDLSRLYSEANLFVLPSSTEGVSLALLEALSSGCLCIVSTLDVPKKLKKHVKFVRYGDRMGMANSIDEIISEEEKYLSFKSDSTKFVRENFSWEKTASQYINLFNKQ